ncbi:MAG: hypothetical protein IPN77_14410 [Sandaracinaceae bacterium]|nr:hypothetical protein [Sandaracinaceae bacterium]
MLLGPFAWASSLDTLTRSYVAVMRSYTNTSGTALASPPASDAERLVNATKRPFAAMTAPPLSPWMPRRVVVPALRSRTNRSPAEGMPPARLSAWLVNTTI